MFRPVPANGVCALLSDKWTVPVLWRLSLAEGHRLRFSTLKKEVDGVTQRMLTLTLRNLERDGLVARYYFPEVPPRVEYELTDMGIGALRALEGFNFWVRDNLQTIRKHRCAYDEVGS
ncbi:helix-turn-helix transcriptional regulator [Pseudomonas sp. GX19020]|uniref:winged helix-turn-helix transcriptional regulator n=1 Tax=Pseudomonas sp. GX19020 TaxID=2942277 RepID=UPI002019DFA7|nr:helix-turn-helix transcriptional regulator [Pseudomonas sp. GX19020]